MGYGYKPKLGLTGEMVEVELFGEVGQKINIDFKKWQREHDALYLPRKLAIKQAQENQTGDPHEPTPQFAYDLYEKVVDNLLRRSKTDNSAEKYVEIFKRVKFFTSVHAPLDYAHGIDAFFEIEDDGRTELISLDASTHFKTKMDADILVQYPPEGLDPKEDKKDWDDLVAMTAASIVEQYDLKIKEHGQRR